MPTAYWYSGGFGRLIVLFCLLLLPHSADGLITFTRACSEGHEFFHNNVSNSSMYEHPMDEHYRTIYMQKREEKLANRT